MGSKGRNLKWADECVWQTGKELRLEFRSRGGCFHVVSLQYMLLPMKLLCCVRSGDKDEVSDRSGCGLRFWRPTNCTIAKHHHVHSNGVARREETRVCPTAVLLMSIVTVCWLRWEPGGCGSGGCQASWPEPLAPTAPKEGESRALHCIVGMRFQLLLSETGIGCEDLPLPKESQLLVHNRGLVWIQSTVRGVHQA